MRHTDVVVGNCFEGGHPRPDRLGLVIDIKFLRDKPDAVRASQRARGEDERIVDALLTDDERRRPAIAEFESPRPEQQEFGQQVADARGEGEAALRSTDRRSADSSSGLTTTRPGAP